MSGSSGNRDATFTLRAADLSSQPIKDVVAQIDKLIASQQSLNASAKVGAVSNSDFTKAINSLQTAFKALVDQKAQLSEFLRVQDQLEAKTQAVAAAQERLSSATAKAFGGDDTYTVVTQKQIAGLDRFEKSLLRTQANADTAGKNFQQLGQTLDRMGVSAENFAEAEAQLAAAIDRVTPSIKAARIEELGLIDNRRQAVAASEAATAAARAETAANEEFAARNRAINQAKTAQDKLDVAEENRNRASVAAGRKFDLEQAFAADDAEAAMAKRRDEAAKASAASARALQASQDKIAQAAEAVPATQAPGQASNVSEPFSQASQAVLGIVNPAAQARQTLEGLTTEINTIAATMDAGRKKVADYQQDIRTLTVVIAELQRQGRLVDTFKTQENDVARLGVALRAEEATLAAQVGLYQRAGVAEQELERRTLSQVNVVKAATEAYNSQNAKLTQTRQALDAAKINYQDVEGVVKSLAAASETAKKAYDIADTAAGKSSQRPNVFLGLKQYELVNLSYQLNDVATQYASGTHVAQIFAQQSGQIFQVFERDIGDFVAKIKESPAALAGFGVAAGVATVAVLALVRALEINEQRQTFIGQLALDIDGARLNIDQLTASAKELTKLGVGVSDAIGGQKVLASQGFDQGQIDRLSKLAALLSASTGKTFAESIKQVSTAFSGGYESLSKFVNEYNLLDAATALNVRNLFEAGKEVEAYALVSEAATKRATDAHTKSASAIGEVYHKLKFVFDELLDGFTSFINAAANGFLRLAELSDKVKPGTYGSKNAQGGGVLGALGIGGFDQKQQDNTPTSQRGDRPAEFSSQRDRAADVAGVDRQVLQALEGSESVFKDGKFQDGIDKNGNVAGRGPLQVTQSTFDDLKKQFPDLLKGPITDVQTNLIAGALYFRQQLEKAGGDVAKATAAYKFGPKVFNDPTFDAGHPEYQKSVRQVAEQSGSRQALTRPQPELVGKPLEVTSAPGTPTQGQQRVTGDFAKQTQDETDKLNDPRLEGNQAIIRSDEVIADEGRKIRAAAIKFAQDNNQAAIDNAKVQELIDSRARVRQAENARARAENEKAASLQIAEIRRKESGDDGTNLQAAQATVNQEFENYTKEIATRFQGLTGAQKVDGKTKDELLAQVEEARKLALDQSAEKVAQAVLDKVLEARKQAFDAIHQTQLMGQVASDAAAKVNATFTPQIKDAVATLNAALDKVPNSPAVQATRAKAAGSLLDISGSQSDTNAALKDAADRSQKPFQDLITIRQNAFNTVIEQEKNGSLSIAKGVQELASITAKLSPDIQKAVAKVNGDLRAILANPALSPVERSNIEAAIAKNTADAAKGQEQLQALIDAGLKDSADKLAADLSSRDSQTSDVLKQFNDGLIGVQGASAKLAQISGQFKDKVAADAAKVISDLQTALATPGLTAGSRAQLQDRLTKAQAVEGSGDRPELEAQGKLANDAVNKLQQQTVGSINDTARTNQQLLGKGLIDVDQAEASNKRAFADANAAAGDQVKQINQLITDYQKLGASAGQVDLLRNKLTLVTSELKYIDPLTQEITQGLEQSFETRGAAAFENVAKSIANLAVNGGKVKDVFIATGQAFASVAAGILEDVAKIILKYELLKLAKSALGVGGDGDGSGGGGASAGGILGSLGGLLGGLGGGGDSFAPGGENGAPIDTVGNEEGLNGGGGGGGAASGLSTASGLVGLIGKIAPLFLHTGGQVSPAASGVRKPVDMTLFYDARRMHDGGTVGLANDEVPAILQRGEQVMSVAQVRAQQAATAGAGSGGTAVRNVLAVGDDEISKAMNGSHGEAVVLNHLRRNAPTVRRILG